VIKGGSHLCAPNYCLGYRPAAHQREAIDTSTSHIGSRVVDTMIANHFGTTDVSRAVRLVFRAYTGMVQAAVADWLVYGRATRARSRCCSCAHCWRSCATSRRR
jgi:hypothetical protein